LCQIYAKTGGKVQKTKPGLRGPGFVAALKKKGSAAKATGLPLVRKNAKARSKRPGFRISDATEAELTHPEIGPGTQAYQPESD
jgi:hypothetical protein